MAAPLERDLAKVLEDSENVRFAPDARAVIRDSGIKARQLLHNYMGTEHILWSLTDRPSIAKGVLNDLGITASRVEVAIMALIGKGDRLVQGEPGFLPTARKSVEIAQQYVGLRGAARISSADLLLGMNNQGSSLANSILDMYGIPKDILDNHLRELLNLAVEKSDADLFPLPFGRASQLARISAYYRDPRVPDSVKQRSFVEIDKLIVTE